MRLWWVMGALTISAIAGLAACSPQVYSTTASFGPPAIVLDPELPEQSYRLRLCWTGDPFDVDETRAHIHVEASSETPVRATMLVEGFDEEPMEIPVVSGAFWLGAVDEACDTGVVVTFALVDPMVDPAEIEWIVTGTVESGAEEETEDLILEFHVDRLD